MHAYLLQIKSSSFSGLFERMFIILGSRLSIKLSDSYSSNYETVDDLECSSARIASILIASAFKSLICSMTWIYPIFISKQ